MNQDTQLIPSVPSALQVIINIHTTLNNGLEKGLSEVIHGIHRTNSSNRF